MRIVDASVLIEALIPGRPLTTDAAAAIGSRGVAPELIDIEVAQVLRRLHRLGEIGGTEEAAAIESLMQMPLTRRSHRPHLARIWQLRDNLSAYDAAYVALAEALRCRLVTADARIAAAPGIRCEVQVLGT